MLVIFDIFLLLALILLVLWVLAVAKIIFAVAGPIIHILLAIGVLFIAVWIVLRLCCGGRYSRRRSTAVV
ncbi:hypothetical protein HDV00_012045 [Rhizophlyctis rosea]|nr:hypothetical protein HDV00_012045 [Rhizophlyctis rosea]